MVRIGVGEQMKKVSNVYLVFGLIIIAVVIGVLMAIAFPLPKPPYQPPGSQQQPSPSDIEAFYIAKTVISIVNTALIIALLYIYAKIYRNIESRFTAGLILTMFVLLLYAISSNPLLQVLVGFRAFGMGPFAMIPDMFATAALVILLYLSLE
jgi:small-conductance mechanosensitive channel